MKTREITGGFDADGLRQYVIANAEGNARLLDAVAPIVADWIDDEDACPGPWALILHHLVSGVVRECDAGRTAAAALPGVEGAEEAVQATRDKATALLEEIEAFELTGDARLADFPRLWRRGRLPW